MKITLLFAFTLAAAFFTACSSDDLDVTANKVTPPSMSTEAD